MFAGKYKYVSGENAEAFLKAMKAPEELIPKGIKMTTTDIEVTQDGESFTVEGGDRKVTFKSGEELDTKWGTHTGKMTITVKDANTMERTVTSDLGSKATEVWKFSEAGLEVTQTTAEGNVQATRKYSRA